MRISFVSRRAVRLVTAFFATIAAFITLAFAPAYGQASPLLQQLEPPCSGFMDNYQAQMAGVGKTGLAWQQTRGQIETIVSSDLTSIGTNKSQLTGTYNDINNRFSASTRNGGRAALEYRWYMCILKARATQLGVNLGGSSSPAKAADSLYHQLASQCDSWIKVGKAAGVTFDNPEDVARRFNYYLDNPDRQKLTGIHSQTIAILQKLSPSSQDYYGLKFQVCVFEARAKQLGFNLGSGTSTPVAPAPQRSQPAPRAPVQAPVAQMPPNVDPSIARGLAKIAQLQPQCGSRRAAVGNENAARGAEIDAAKVVEEADWLNLESVTRQAAAKVTDNSVYSRQADYRACLYAAEGRIKKAQPSNVQYTPAEARGAQIVAALDGRCMNQKTAAMRLYGSVAELVADNRILYNAISGSPARVSTFNANVARNAQNEPAAADVYAYWSCLAQARLQQMDDGSASSSPQTAQNNAVRNDGPKGPVPNVAVNTVMNGPAGLPTCIRIEKVGTSWNSPKAEIDPQVVTTVRMTNACGKNVLILVRYSSDGDNNWTDAVWKGGMLFANGALRSWPVGPARPVIPFPSTDRDMVEPFEPGTVVAEIIHGAAKVYGPINFKLAYCPLAVKVDGEWRTNVLFHEVPADGVGRIVCVPLPKGY